MRFEGGLAWRVGTSHHNELSSWASPPQAEESKDLWLLFQGLRIHHTGETGAKIRLFLTRQNCPPAFAD